MLVKILKAFVGTDCFFCGEFFRWGKLEEVSFCERSDRQELKKIWTCKKCWGEKGENKK